jgi:hypothetical protein
LRAAAGLEFDFGEKLSGDISAGYVRENFDDDRLAPIAGPSVEANVNWSPIRGTIVAFNGSTEVEGSTTPGDSGSILYASRLNIERQMRSNLIGNLAGGAAYRDYSGTSDHDTILSAEASLTWWFNRYLGLTTRARHETVTSTLPDRDTKTNSIFIGLKAQR